MKRPYSTYLLAVVLPSALAVVAVLSVARAEWSAVRRTSDERVARMLLAAFEHELGEVTDSVVAAAQPTAELDAGSPAVTRAMAGDTVTGIRPDVGSPAVFALAPPHPDDPPGSVRAGSRPLDPRLPELLGRATGYALSLYLNGHRWASSAEPAGPEELPGTRTARPVGALASLDGGAADQGAIVAWARRPGRVPDPVPVPLLMTIALLLLFATLTGWIQIAGRPATAPPRRSRSMMLVSLVPALTAGAFMMQLDRVFVTRLGEVTAEDLSRGLAVASVRGVMDSPGAVSRLTGFDAAVVKDGTILAGSVEGPAPGVAALAAPPASITSTGRVVTQRGPAAYAARRTGPDGAFLVASTPETSEALAALRARARTISVLLGVWLVGVGIVYAVRGRKVSG